MPGSVGAPPPLECLCARDHPCGLRRHLTDPIRDSQRHGHLLLSVRFSVKGEGAFARGMVDGGPSLYWCRCVSSEHTPVQRLRETPVATVGRWCPALTALIVVST